MTKSKKRPGFVAVLLETIGWPLIWGTAATFGFYFLVQQKIIASPMIARYTASHPVEIVEVWLFFVALASILLKLLEVVNQFSFTDEVKLPARPEGGQRVSQAAVMLQGLNELPRDVRRSYVGRRFADALDYVRLRCSAGGLEQELKSLADNDQQRQHDSLAFARIIVWAIPMLGFLGTVIGITMSLADLSPQNLVSSPETAMEGMLAGLGVAFDTTALALSLAIVLMFTQFVTTRIETQLLDHITAHIASELIGRFEDYTVEQDPSVAKMAHLTEIILRSTEQMFQQSMTKLELTNESMLSRQAELWTETITAAQAAWRKTVESSGSRGEVLIGDTLLEQAHHHAQLLLQQESHASERLSAHWQRLEGALTENAHVMQSQQTELVRQGDHVLQIMDRIGTLAESQKLLVHNLAALQEAGHLSGSVQELAAVSHLLNARLGLAAEQKLPGSSRIVTGAGQGSSAATDAGAASSYLRVFPRDGVRRAA